MSRRFLLVLIALAVAFSGYRPGLGMTAASAAPMQMSAGMDGDCPEKMKDDCCDQTSKDKRLCLWSDACAARCHVNAGIEAAFLAPPSRNIRAEIIAMAEPSPLHTARAGLLFRPPIV